MWKLTKGNEFLPNVSVKRLQEMYDEEKNAKAKLRLLSAVHRKRGKSIDGIAHLLSKPRRTIHGWLTRFQMRGVSGKDSIKQSGRPATLTLTQRKNLVKDLERGPPHNVTGLWSTKELKNLLKRKYQVEFVNQHVFGDYLFPWDSQCNVQENNTIKNQTKKRLYILKKSSTKSEILS